MKRKLILILILFVTTFLLSGCLFWGGYGYYGYPVGFGVVYSPPPHGHGHHPYHGYGYGNPGGHYRYR